VTADTMAAGRISSPTAPPRCSWAPARPRGPSSPTCSPSSTDALRSRAPAPTSPATRSCGRPRRRAHAAGPDRGRIYFCSSSLMSAASAPAPLP
jgi:hypothetical protein